MLFAELDFGRMIAGIIGAIPVWFFVLLMYGVLGWLGWIGFTVLRGIYRGCYSPILRPQFVPAAHAAAWQAKGYLTAVQVDMHAKELRPEFHWLGKAAAEVMFDHGKADDPCEGLFLVAWSFGKLVPDAPAPTEAEIASAVADYLSRPNGTVKVYAIAPEKSVAFERQYPDAIPAEAIPAQLAQCPAERRRRITSSIEAARQKEPGKRVFARFAHKPDPVTATYQVPTTP